MLRTISLIFLGALIGFQCSIQTIVLINWKINQKRITEKYCINKDKPVLKCNGKCYLARQMRATELESQRLEQEERSSNNIPLKKVTNPDVFLAFDSVLWKIEYKPESNRGKYFGAVNLSLQNPFQNSIFHPPC